MSGNFNGDGEGRDRKHKWLPLFFFFDARVKANATSYEQLSGFCALNAGFSVPTIGAN